MVLDHCLLPLAVTLCSMAIFAYRWVVSLRNHFFGNLPVALVGPIDLLLGLLVPLVPAEVLAESGLEYRDCRPMRRGRGWLNAWRRRMPSPIPRYHLHTKLVLLRTGDCTDKSCSLELLRPGAEVRAERIAYLPMCQNRVAQQPHPPDEGFSS